VDDFAELAHAFLGKIHLENGAVDEGDGDIQSGEGESHIVDDLLKRQRNARGNGRLGGVG